MIKDALSSLIQNNNLEGIDIREVFDEIVSGLADETTISSSLLQRLKIKGETPEDIASAILSCRESVKKIPNPLSDTIEGVIFELDKDFVDIGVALDIICAANGLGALRYHFNSPFCKNRSFEILKEMECISPDIKDFERFSFYYATIPADSSYFKYTGEIARKLNFDSIFNITDKMLNPYCAQNQTIGVNKKEDVEKFAAVSLLLNNLNTIVISGEEKLPYITPFGKSYVAEAWKNKIFTYVITPDLLGFDSYDINDLKCDSTEHNALILIDILNNKKQGAIYDTLIMNAAAALYISKKAPSLMDGIDLAKKTIKEGIAFEKYKQIRYNV